MERHRGALRKLEETRKKELTAAATQEGEAVHRNGVTSPRGFRASPGSQHLLKGAFLVKHAKTSYRACAAT